MSKQQYTGLMQHIYGISNANFLALTSDIYSHPRRTKNELEVRLQGIL